MLWTERKYLKTKQFCKSIRNFVVNIIGTVMDVRHMLKAKSDEVVGDKENVFVLLCGSRARGDFSSESDYDLIFWNLDKNDVDIFKNWIKHEAINAEYHYYFEDGICYNVNENVDEDGKFAILDAEKLNSTIYSKEFLTYRDNVVANQKLCEVLTGRITLSNITFGNRFRTLTRSDKDNRQSICALIRLIYARGVYQNGDTWLISNYSRFETYARKHEVDLCYKAMVLDLLSNLRSIDWSNISLSNYCAICVLFQESRSYNAN